MPEIIQVMFKKETAVFREACEEHIAEMEKLVFELLKLVAMSLGLPKDRFNDFFKDQTSRVRLNHYPPCPAPDLALGLGRHKDTGVLTVLAQDDVAGLEVKRKPDGEWILVKPCPDSYVINVGDILQVQQSLVSSVTFLYTSYSLYTTNTFQRK